MLYEIGFIKMGVWPDVCHCHCQSSSNDAEAGKDEHELIQRQLVGSTAAHCECWRISNSKCFIKVATGEGCCCVLCTLASAAGQADALHLASRRWCLKRHQKQMRDETHFCYCDRIWMQEDEDSSWRIISWCNRICNFAWAFWYLWLVFFIWIAFSLLNIFCFSMVLVFPQTRFVALSLLAR